MEAFLGDLMPEFFDLVSGELDYRILRPGDFKDKIVFINQQLKNLSPAALAVRREAWLKQSPESVWADLSLLRESNKLVVATI